MKVALYFSKKGRYENLRRALALIEDEIVSAVDNKKEIVLKPNLVNENSVCGLTHRDALQALIDFFEEKMPSARLIIAEDTAVGETFRAMAKQRYFELKSKRPLIFRNLKFDDREIITLYDRRLNKTLKQQIYKTLVDAEFLVSVALPKTHDTVVVTLSLKNIFVGALYEKVGRGPTIHQGYPAINRSLAELANYVYPHLGVIDGWIGMEGEGPSHGDCRKLYFAGVSLDPLALDLVVAKTMGFEITQIGYLELLRRKRNLSLDKIKVVSNRPWQKINFKLKPHSTFSQQINWENERKGTCA